MSQTPGPDEPDEEPDVVPEEFDPASLGPDPPEPNPPNQDAGASTQPGEDVIEELTPDPPEIGEDVDAEIVGLFWLLVVVFNVAVFCLAVGPMMIVTQGWWDAGLQVFAVGVVVLSYGLYRYYDFVGNDADDADDANGANDAA